MRDFFINKKVEHRIPMLYFPFATIIRTTFNASSKRKFATATSPKKTAIISSPISLLNTNITEEVKAKMNNMNVGIYLINGFLYDFLERRNVINNVIIKTKYTANKKIIRKPPLQPNYLKEIRNL